MPSIPIAYIEIPTTNVVASKDFYGSLFGWTFTDYGPEYASFEDAGVQGGFHGGTVHQTKAPLPVLQTDDLEGLLARIEAGGGAVTVPIFAFPGGRRFHFTDPSGQELAVMQAE